MTTHAPPTPDVEAFVFAALRDLGGIHVMAIDASTPWPHVTDVVTVQVDVRASTKVRARDRAYEARQRLLAMPFDLTSPVRRVDVVSGPLFLADEDGAPRYIIRTSVTVRATRQ